MNLYIVNSISSSVERKKRKKNNPKERLDMVHYFQRYDDLGFSFFFDGRKKEIEIENDNENDVDRLKIKIFKSNKGIYFLSCSLTIRNREDIQYLQGLCRIYDLRINLILRHFIFIFQHHL
jgi:hypothetical protein